MTKKEYIQKIMHREGLTEIAYMPRRQLINNNTTVTYITTLTIMFIAAMIGILHFAQYEAKTCEDMTSYQQNQLSSMVLCPQGSLPFDS